MLRTDPHPDISNTSDLIFRFLLRSSSMLLSNTTSLSPPSGVLSPTALKLSNQKTTTPSKQERKFDRNSERISNERIPSDQSKPFSIDDCKLFFYFSCFYFYYCCCWFYFILLLLLLFVCFVLISALCVL
jgi:hypothetical protein